MAEINAKMMDNDKPRRVEDKIDILIKKKQINANSKIYYALVRAMLTGKEIVVSFFKFSL